MQSRMYSKTLFVQNDKKRQTGRLNEKHSHTHGCAWKTSFYFSFSKYVVQVFHLPYKAKKKFPPVKAKIFAPVLIQQREKRFNAGNYVVIH